MKKIKFDRSKYLLKRYKDVKRKINELNGSNEK